MSILLSLGFIWLALIAFLVIQFTRAPHGYQDEQGFHFVRTPSVARPARRVANAGFRHAGLRLSHASLVR